MKNTVNSFMSNHFDNLTLKSPLFYTWKYGIRFEIATPSKIEHEDPRNLQQIKERSTGIFDHAFHDADKMLLITDIHCEKKNTLLRKRPTNVYVKYIKKKELRNTLKHSLLPSLIYDPEAKDYDEKVTHRFFLTCTKKDIKYHQLLTAISCKDFSHPTRILKRYYHSDFDIYFINMTKKLIYHLYDDRGCDVIASHKEDLHSLYQACNDWILEYDRGRIEEIFS